MPKYPENQLSGKVFLNPGRGNFDVQFFAPRPATTYGAGKNEAQLLGVSMIHQQRKPTSFSVSCKKYLTESKFSATNCPRNLD